MALADYVYNGTERNVEERRAKGEWGKMGKGKEGRSRGLWGSKSEVVS